MLGVVDDDGGSSKFQRPADSLPEAAAFSLLVLDKEERMSQNGSDEERRGSDEVTENGSTRETTAARCAACASSHRSPAVARYGRQETGETDSATRANAVDLVCLTAAEVQQAVIGGAPFL